jgi:hypothetical protein
MALDSMRHDALETVLCLTDEAMRLRRRARRRRRWAEIMERAVGPNGLARTQARSGKKLAC